MEVNSLPNISEAPSWVVQLEHHTSGISHLESLKANKVCSKALENMTYKEGLEELIIALKGGNPIKVLKYLHCKKRIPALLSMLMEVRKEINWSNKKKTTEKQATKHTEIKKTFAARESECLKWTPWPKW